MDVQRPPAAFGLDGLSTWSPGRGTPTAWGRGPDVWGRSIGGDRALAEGSRVECGTAGRPWPQEHGEPRGPPVSEAFHPLASPHSPSVLAASYLGALEPGAATAHPPVTLGPLPTLPVDHPLTDCPLLPHVNLDEALPLSYEGWGAYPEQRPHGNTFGLMLFLTENPPRADASPGAGAVETKVSALECTASAGEAEPANRGCSLLS